MTIGWHQGVFVHHIHGFCIRLNETISHLPCQNYNPMNVKIDTKEKFHVIRLPEGPLTANMAVDLSKIITNCRIPQNVNVIIDMSSVSSLDPEVTSALLEEQVKAYNMQHSFVVCCLAKDIEKQLNDLDILDQMNHTRTESEAWDIVQMEEIERELLD